jgi:dTDP-glucose 4,6-dehydratase
MSKRILLTGAAGFLGAHCLRWLLATTDWTFACPVSFRHKGVPERLTWAMEQGLEFGARPDPWGRVDLVLCDLSAPINETTSRKFGDVDIVLNFAADTHAPRSVAQPETFIRNNVEISLSLLDWQRRARYQCQAFVQISTDSVYGPAGLGETHREWDAIVPANPYSASKACQEAIGIAYWRTYGIPVSIMATMNPIGETQDREKFIPGTIAKILAGQTVTIHATKMVDPVSLSPINMIGGRIYIDADQMIEGLAFLLEAAPPAMFGHGGAQRPDRWNIVGARELTNLDVAWLIANELGLPLHYEIVAQADRPEHGHRYAMSGEKLSACGWKADDDIEATIRRVTRWTKDHPLWA